MLVTSNYYKDMGNTKETINFASKLRVGKYWFLFDIH